MDIFSISPTAKYINRYISKDDYTELHITNLKDYDIVLKIDNEDVEKLQKHFWCCAMVGRKGYKTPNIYCYNHRVHLFLTRVLLNVEQNQKVIFKNGDNLDFRKKNLHIANPKESFVRDDSNKSLPTGVFARTQKNGHSTGYVVHYFEDGVKKVKYFGIRNYQNLHNALDKALLFKQQSLQKQNLI